MLNNPRFAIDPNSNALYDPVSKREVSLEEIFEKDDAPAAGNLQRTSGGRDATQFDCEGHMDADAALGERYNYDKELSEIHDSHRRRMLLCCGHKRQVVISELCSVLIVAVVLVAFMGPVFSAYKRGKIVEGRSPSSLYNNDGPLFILPEPPDDLDIICDVSSVETPNGYATCRSICRTAMCCQTFVPAQFEIESCVKGNEYTCAKYAQCLTLTAYTGHEEREGDNQGDGPDPGTVFSESTAIDKGDNGAIEAEQSNTDGIFLPGEYSPNKEGTSVSTSTYTDGNPTWVEELCGDNSTLLHSTESRNDCREFCKARGCCFASLRGEPEFDCSAEFPAWCDEYGPCQNLYKLEAPQKPVTQQQHDKGTVDQLPPHVEGIEGSNTFHFVSAQDESTKLEDEVDESYLVVPVAVGGTANDQYVASWIGEICSMTKIETAGGRARCSRACRDRRCCFDDDSTKNCLVTLAYWCLPYVACGNLKSLIAGSDPIDLSDFFFEKDDDVNALQTDPSTIVDSGDKLSFSTSTSTSLLISTSSTGTKTTVGVDNDIDVGFVYQAHGKVTPADEAFEHSAAVVSFPTIKTDTEVDDACDPTRLRASVLAREECKLLCDRRACCFAGLMLGCRPELPEWCDEYNSCNHLLHFGTTDGDGDPTAVNAITTMTSATAETTVEELCSSASIQTAYGLEQCGERCERRSCCFLPSWDGDSCYHAMRNWCEEYSACRPLYPLSPRNPSRDDSGSEIAEEPATATKDNTPKTTITTTVVAAVAATTSMDTDTHLHQKETAKEVDINIICSNERLADTRDGYQSCRTACNKRKCCFVKTSWGNCRDRFPAACNEYSICEGIYKLRFRKRLRR